MDSSHAHLPFGGQMNANGPSANDLAHISFDFDSIMAPDNTMSYALRPFESCIHDDSCLDHHHHLRQPRSSDKLQGGFAQQLQLHAPLSTIRTQRLPRLGEHHNPPSAAAASPLLHHPQAYTWETLLSDSPLDNTAMHAANFGFCREDDCVSECSSACDGSCPSQCGDTGPRVCCDDDACGSPQLCLDEACPGTFRPCTDESCLADTMLGQQVDSNPAMTDGDKAAAAALTSFGDSQLHMAHGGGFMSSSPAPPPSSRDGSLPYIGLPESLPCGSLSMESIFTNGPPSFPNQPSPLAFEYALASHIVQYHDPSRGLAHTGACVANDPGQLISRCTLPKFHPNDDATDPYLSQLQAHECGFLVQDPNTFAHHIFQEHRPALMLQTQQLGFPAAPHSRVHANNRAPHQHGPHAGCHTNTHMAQGKHFSPSPSPLTNMSIASSLSTPCSLATPSPLEPDASQTELSFIGRRPSSVGGPRSEAPAHGDQFLCRWLTGDDDCICGKRFDDDEQLQKHCKLDHLKQLKKVGGVFRCGWANCTRNTCFTQRSKVERHMQVHTGYKPVHCNICGAALSAKQALDQHMRIHTGETPWMCKFPGCGCAFKQQSALTMHERTHTGDKPLECEICHKRFSESSNLSKHRRTHNVKGMHECQLCGKDFHRLDQLRRHMGTNHKDRPADVDALLSKAKNGFQAHKVTKTKKSTAGARGRAGSETLSAHALELVHDQLQ